MHTRRIHLIDEERESEIMIMEINAYSTLTEYSEPRVASSPVQSQGLPHINPTNSSSDYPAGFEKSDNVESPSATSEGQNSSEATENQKQSSTLDYEALNTFSAHIHELYEYIFSRFNVSAGSRRNGITVSKPMHLILLRIVSFCSGRHKTTPCSSWKTGCLLTPPGSRCFPRPASRL